MESSINEFDPLKDFLDTQKLKGIYESTKNEYLKAIRNDRLDL